VVETGEILRPARGAAVALDYELQVGAFLASDWGLREPLDERRIPPRPLDISGLTGIGEIAAEQRIIIKLGN
jgi:hypothetical protein